MRCTCRVVSTQVYLFLKQLVGHSLAQPLKFLESSLSEPILFQMYNCLRIRCRYTNFDLSRAEVYGDDVIRKQVVVCLLFVIACGCHPDGRSWTSTALGECLATVCFTLVPSLPPSVRGGTVGWLGGVGRKHSRRDVKSARGVPATGAASSSSCAEQWPLSRRKCSLVSPIQPSICTAHSQLGGNFNTILNRWSTFVNANQTRTLFACRGHRRLAHWLAISLAFLHIFCDK